MRSFVFFAALSLVACAESHERRGLVDARVDRRDAASPRDGSPAPNDAAAGDRCEEPSDCVVVPISCCGECGQPSRGDAIAIARSRVAEQRAEACAVDGDCPACALPPDPTLVASCEAGRCVLVDLAAAPLTQCSRAEDCRLRAARCCECGADLREENLIAIRADGEAEYRALVCDFDAACAGCAPIYPSEYSAACASGRCAVLVRD